MTRPAPSKRKRGRPLSPLDRRIQIRLRSGEVREWTAIAHKAGLTLPQWIRLVCTMHAGRT